MHERRRLRENIETAADAHDILPLAAPFANDEWHAGVDDPPEMALKDARKIVREGGIVNEIAEVEMTWNQERGSSGVSYTRGPLCHSLAAARWSEVMWVRERGVLASPYVCGAITRRCATGS